MKWEKQESEREREREEGKEKIAFVDILFRKKERKAEIFGLIIVIGK